MQPVPQGLVSRGPRRGWLVHRRVQSVFVEFGIDACLACLDLALQHVVARQRLFQARACERNGLLT